MAIKTKMTKQELLDLVDLLRSRIEDSNIDEKTIKCFISFESPTISEPVNGYIRHTFSGESIVEFRASWYAGDIDTKP